MPSRVILAPQVVTIKNSFSSPSTGILKWKFNILSHEDWCWLFAISYFSECVWKVKRKTTIIFQRLCTSMIYSNIHNCENSLTSWTFTMYDIFVSLKMMRNDERLSPIASKINFFLKVSSNWFFPAEMWNRLN